jgi:ribonuclease Z
MVPVIAALFAAIGVGFWIAPVQVGQIFQLEATGAAGVTALRADLGGLFVGLAMLCLWGMRGGRSLAFKSAAVVVAAIVTGRVIALLTNGWTDQALPSLAAELAALGTLGLCVRAPSIAKGPRPGSVGRGLILPVVIGVALLVVVGAVALRIPAVQEGIFSRAAARLTASVNTAPLEDEALRVAVCGSSAPLASADRAKACVAVFAGGKYYVVDVGPESVENLVLWNIPLADIGGVLLTHFHSDHIGDLGELNLQSWAQGRPAPMKVYGGPGVERLVDGFNMAYGLDQGYRTAHHTERLLPAATWPMIAHTVELDGPATSAKSRTGIVLDDGELRITAIEVEHAPIAPAYAYRFDYKGRSVVITGDTKFHPPLAQAAEGADILVSEAIARSMIETLENGAIASGRHNVAAIMHDIQDYHISPEEVAGIANDAGVKLLVFYHLLPAPDASLTRRMFARGVDGVREGRWVTADDGSLYTLPTGSDEVHIGRIQQ